MFHSLFFTFPLLNVNTHLLQFLGTQPHVVLVLHLVSLDQGVDRAAKGIEEFPQPFLTPAKLNVQFPQNQGVKFGLI